MSPFTWIEYSKEMWDFKRFLSGDLVNYIQMKFEEMDMNNKSLRPQHHHEMNFEKPIAKPAIMVGTKFL